MERHIGRIKIAGNSNLGMFAVPTEELCFVGSAVTQKAVGMIEELLKVKTIHVSVAHSDIIGAFVAANSNGVVLPKNTADDEIAKFKKLGLNITILQNKITALGNVILVNDRGCIISQELESMAKQIGETLCVDVAIGTIAGLHTVGSCAIATNRGMLVHRSCTEDEMKHLESVLKVNGDIGTASFGSPFVGAAILANGRGFIASEQTTGPELQRIDESLGFLRTEFEVFRMKPETIG